jgi:hypothetical protein
MDRLPEVDDGAVALVVIVVADLADGPGGPVATCPSRSFISDLLDNGADLGAVHAMAGYASRRRRRGPVRRGEHVKQRVAGVLMVSYVAC